MIKRMFLLAAATLLLTACASPQPADHAGQTPTLDLRRYFDGTLTAHGLFTDRAGKVKRRFSVQLAGRWDGDDGVLDETFHYSDGEVQQRRWHITHLGDGRYRGRADDVVGDAVGQAAGNALRWQYTLRLPVDGTVYEVQFDDWMYLMDERVMLNKAVVSKFGIRIGEVTLAFVKP
jgi:hypothetical protein